MSDWSDKETRTVSTGGRARASLGQLRKRYGCQEPPKKPPALVFVRLPAMGAVPEQWETWKQTGPAEGESTAYELIETKTKEAA